MYFTAVFSQCLGTKAAHRRSQVVLPSRRYFEEGVNIILSQGSGINPDLVFLSFNGFSVDMTVASLLYADNVKLIVLLNYYETLSVAVAQSRKFQQLKTWTLC